MRRMAVRPERVCNSPAYMRISRKLPLMEAEAMFTPLETEAPCREARPRPMALYAARKPGPRWISMSPWRKFAFTAST